MKDYNLEDVKFARVKKVEGKCDYILSQLFQISNVRINTKESLFSFNFENSNGNNYGILKGCSHLNDGEWEFLDQCLNVIDANKLYDKLSNLVKAQEFESEPFDLQRAIAGEPVWTRDKKEVKSFHFFNEYDENEEEFPIRCLINGRVEGFIEQGKYYDHNENSDFDLFMKVKKKFKKTAWICFEKENHVNGNFKRSTNAYPTKEKAEEQATLYEFRNYETKEIEYYE